jgi:hypothetical protein
MRQHDRLERYATVVGSVITGSITGLGVVVTLFTLVYVPRELKRIEMKLGYVEEQLEKLYGPLLAECLQADSTFRRVELAIARLSEGTDADHHRHYDLRQLSVMDFATGGTHFDGTTVLGRRRFFATVLKDVYVPANRRRVNLLKHNLHLLGPNPPLSLALLLSHATQLDSLIRVKQMIDLPCTNASLGRYEDPYILAPFPANLTGEVIAKVAWLKALQREYRYRLARSRSLWAFVTRKQVYRRDQYFLLLNEKLRDELNALTSCHSSRREDQTAFHPHTFPLVWGPYVAVELFELRSWLITREIALRSLDTLAAERRLFQCLLQAPVVRYDKRGDVKCKVHYRVAQPFDELDKPGSKMNFPWDCNFTWERLQKDETAHLQYFAKENFSLRDIPKASKIAYDRKAHNEMLEMYSGRQD